MLLDRPLLGIVFLAGVAGEAHRAVGHRAKEPLDCLGLRIDQGIHRVDDDGANPSVLGAVAQHMIDDGNQVGETLARPRAGGDDIVGTRGREIDGALLVAIELQGAQPTDPIRDAEQVTAERMQDAVGDHIVHRAGLGVRGGELHQRVRPEPPLGEGVIDVGRNLRIGNSEKAAGIGRILVDDLLTELKNIHTHPHTMVLDWLVAARGDTVQTSMR